MELENPTDKYKRLPVEEVRRMIKEITGMPEVNKEEERKRQGKEATAKIQELIESGPRVFPNSYPSIIEIICSIEYQDQIEQIIYKHKIDKNAPDVCYQEPSLANAPLGMVAYQLYLTDTRYLASSGYDVISMVKELKDLPVLFTLSVVIPKKEFARGLK